MTKKLQAQSNDWMVFLDGVQIPWLGFTYSFGVDTVPTGALQLEDDALLLQVRPGAVVALFFRERYASSDRPFAQQWMYYGGGEVIGISDHRQPRSRSMELRFGNDVGYLQRHAAYASSLGGSFPTISGLASGSLIPSFGGEGNSAAGAGDGWASAALLIATLSQDEETTATERTNRYRGGATPGSEGFGGRLLRVMTWLTAHNAALRMHAERTRLIGRVCALNDAFLRSAATARIAAAGLASHVAAGLSSANSVYDVLRSLASFSGYNISYAAAPCFPTQQPLAPEKVPTIVGMLTSDATEMWRAWYRNDVMLLPRLHYAPPPPCNFMFPDMVASKSLSRDFSGEATRLVHITEELSSNIALVAGGRLPDGVIPKHPAEYWGNLVGYLATPPAEGRPPLASDDTFRSPDKSVYSSNINLLNLVADVEFERGIQLQRLDTDAESMYALSKAFTEQDDVKPTASDGTVAEEKLGSAVNNKFANNDYFRYLQRWLTYKHRLAQRSYTAGITLNGHRWLVPGFSAVMFASDVSYIGFIESVSTSVSADGAEQNSVSMSQVRPLSTISRYSDATAKASLSLSERLSTHKKTAVPSAYDQDNADVDLTRRQLQENTVKLNVLAERMEALPAGSQRARVETEYRSVQSDFSVQFLKLTTRAERYADAAYGARRSQGAVFAVANSPNLAEPLSSFKAYQPPSDIGAPGKATEHYEVAAKAAATVVGFNVQQVDYYRRTDSVAAPPTNVVEAINTSQSLLFAAEQAIREAAIAVEQDEVVAVPPPFYNPDLLQPTAADKVYQDLLGTKAFYSDPGYAIPYAPPPEIGPAVLGEEATAADAHARMIQSLARVFPALRNTSVTKLPADTGSYDDWNTATDVEGGSMAWQHRKFLTRSAQTLDSYLKTHGFEANLESLISDEPSPTVFLRMVPVPSGAPTTINGTSWPWDDSVVSRIVDAGALRNAAPLGTVAERRAVVTNPALSSKYRQDIAVAYSRRHFGSRALGGEP